MKAITYEYKNIQRNKNYKRTEVLISINDHATIKQYCSDNGISIGDYIYTLIIKDMASRGIRLEGTATRNVDDIINNVASDDVKKAQQGDQ